MSWQAFSRYPRTSACNSKIHRHQFSKGLFRFDKEVISPLKRGFHPTGISFLSYLSGIVLQYLLHHHQHLFAQVTWHWFLKPHNWFNIFLQHFYNSGTLFMYLQMIINGTFSVYIGKYVRVSPSGACSTRSAGSEPQLRTERQSLHSDTSRRRRGHTAQCPAGGWQQLQSEPRVKRCTV